MEDGSGQLTYQQYNGIPTTKSMQWKTVVDRWPTNNAIGYEQVNGMEWNKVVDRWPTNNAIGYEQVNGVEWNRIR